jgi:DNA-binding NarL/FixJ family response regulator
VPDAPTIRVLIADEHALFREAVRVVLDSEPDVTVVAEARDGLRAVAEAERVRPDVALIDVGLPNCDGVRATTLIKQQADTCRVLILAPREDMRLLEASIEAGANGFLTKEAPLDELIAATRAVHRGETLIPPRLLGGLLARLIRRRREQDVAIRRISKLTRREREVLALLAGGADNETIAQRLVVSPQTARTHIQNVLAKLGVHSRLEAAMFVTQNGILDELVPMPS